MMSLALGIWFHLPLCAYVAIFENTTDTISAARIFDLKGLKHKSHAMTSSTNLERKTFYGAKISEDVAWFGT